MKTIHLVTTIAALILSACNEAPQKGYPDWLLEYDATFILPDALETTDTSIPPCTCYLSPEGKPIVWIKKNSLTDSIRSDDVGVQEFINTKGGIPMDP